jgi:hypothetical protein
MEQKPLNSWEELPLPMEKKTPSKKYLDLLNKSYLQMEHDYSGTKNATT